MRYEGDFEDFSDGKLYELNDMVKSDTRGCDNCSACCRGMGDSIRLTPYDLYRIEEKTGLTYKELLKEHIGVVAEDKLLRPYLKMTEATSACSFLGEDERCGIHDSRPDICRLFPLGRAYLEDDYKYIFKSGECVKPNLSKVKVKKWIDMANYKDHKAFILAWHQFLKALRFRVKFVEDDEIDRINKELVHLFYQWDPDINRHFYSEFSKRLVEAKANFSIL